MKPVVKGLLISFGALSVVVTGVIIWGVVWLMTTPEGGVKLGNEMDAYALEYIAEHQLLNDGEELQAYYDVTVSMDGTEAALVTDQRVVYHKNGSTTSIAIKDIELIEHRNEGLIGDIIEVQAFSGQMMKIEIAPLNQGETFLKVLQTTWDKHGSPEIPHANT